MGIFGKPLKGAFRRCMGLAGGSGLYFFENRPLPSRCTIAVACPCLGSLCEFALNRLEAPEPETCFAFEPKGDASSLDWPG